jgi:GST-like protein
MSEKDPANNLPAGYQVPEVWVWDKDNGGAFASTNRPTAGATQQKELPVGKHPFQLYSLATPNGQKVTIMLEELLEAGHSGAEYDAWLIEIGKGDQFGSGFVDVNPNSKIPALVDQSGDASIRVFESGSILVHLAEKFDAFLPKEAGPRAQTMNWLFWQMGSAPFLGGGFGHFFTYAPIHIKYAIDRFAMETKRQLDVLDKHLADNRYLAGETYTIADMAVWPWYGGIALGNLYPGSDRFLEVSAYTNLQRWAKDIAERPAVKRGKIVNKPSGEEGTFLRERHSSEDFLKVKGL